jgi:gluconokinase
VILLKAGKRTGPGGRTRLVPLRENEELASVRRIRDRSTECYECRGLMIIVVLGVTGAGKSTVGAALAARLGWRFVDADDFHSEANWRKLERGEALTDEDRAPWLAALRALVGELTHSGTSAVLACSALRAEYRRTLIPEGASAGDVRFVYLHADALIIRRRLHARTDHRASPALLDSQLAMLEEPVEALSLKADVPTEQLVDEIIAEWKLQGT